MHCHSNDTPAPLAATAGSSQTNNSFNSYHLSRRRSPRDCILPVIIFSSSAEFPQIKCKSGTQIEKNLAFPPSAQTNTNSANERMHGIRILDAASPDLHARREQKMC